MYLWGKTGTKKKGKAALKKNSNTCTEATLWGWFSKFIRLRDSDSNGRCKCATCNRSFHWKEMDAGHFISRRHKATKYDERNVMAQCQSCNRFHGGEQFKMSIEVDRRHGKGTAELLSDLSRVRAKHGGMWFKAQTEKYKKLVKEML